MPTLTKEQLTAIASLAAGDSQGDAAKKAGVSRSSVCRWVKDEDFQAEIERRKKSAEDLRKSEFDRVQAEEIKEEVKEVQETLKAYRLARLRAYRQTLELGLHILNKTGKRFKDLPDEAIAPNMIPAMLKAGSELAEQGFDGWAELIGVEQVLGLLDGQQEGG